MRPLHPFLAGLMLLATAGAGDQIIVRPGRYAGFNLTTSGTAANPIAFGAEPGVVVDAPDPVRRRPR